MLNQAVLVGRIVQDPELRETENGNKIANMTLAVPRSYKNANGEYDTDFISCVLWKGVAENTVEYCKKGDLVGKWFCRYNFFQKTRFYSVKLEFFWYLQFLLFVKKCYNI